MKAPRPYSTTIALGMLQGVAPGLHKVPRRPLYVVAKGVHFPLDEFTEGTVRSHAETSMQFEAVVAYPREDDIPCCS